MLELREEFEKGEASELTHEHKKIIFTTLLERSYSHKESNLSIEVAKFIGFAINQISCSEK